LSNQAALEAIREFRAQAMEDASQIRIRAHHLEQAYQALMRQRESVSQR
jgi:hypothetical protein